MVYTIYRTTNTINGRFYIGVHKTNKPMDAYLGSGKYIRRAVAKYGKKYFTKEVLFEFDNLPDALRKEYEMVELFRRDQLCVNLRQGGSGGFDYVNPLISHEDRVARGKAMVATIRRKIETDPIYAQEWLKKQMLQIKCAASGFNEEAKRRAAEGRRRTWIGRYHSDATKLLISEKAKNRTVGELNSQFGTRWITDGTKNRKIEASESLPKGWQYGRSMGQVA